MHNSERLVKGRERCTLLMHPRRRARPRAAPTASGARHARAWARSSVPLEVTRRDAPGVVSLPHGWGHGRPGTRLAVASERPGVSFNDLTDEALVDPLCGTAGSTACPVEVMSAG